MPRDKDFKRIVRRRMAATGQPYTAARAALNPEPVGPRQDADRWVERLGAPEDAHAAYAALRALPPERLAPAAMAGLGHPDWRVRRGCCRLLGGLTRTAEVAAALERRLGDAHPLVRRAALGALSCRGCDADIRGLFERMAADPSRRVRAAVLHPLTWAYVDEAWTPDLLRRFAERDPSERLRKVAAAEIEARARRAHANELRLRLPAELRARTERHQGQWVAIAAGRIVAVADLAAIRTARRRHSDTEVYWVAPSSEAREATPPPR